MIPLISKLRYYQKYALILVLTAVIAFPTASVLVAQDSGRQTPPDQRLEWYQNHVAMEDQSLFKNLRWQFLGPTNTSGRMTDVAVAYPKGENYTMYVAGASGGVWKTVNEGVTWEPVFEHGPSTSIGDVTIDPSNPNIVWIGTGEANIFRSSMAGAGVFKSTDAGATWDYMGLAGTHTIARIVVHPTESDIVYVAASGHEWTNNEERGLYRTTDGGRNWEKILDRGEQTGAIDLVMDPSNPNTLYAATWQRIRDKWNDPRNEPWYSNSAVLKSTDGGDTWHEITDGLPAPQHRGRIGIDVAASNPEVVYAFVDNYETAREPEEGATDAYGRPRGPIIKGATVFRSDNGGANWYQVSEAGRYMEGLSGTYGWVFGQMRVDPNNEDRIYVMGLALNVSDDGGKTFRRLTGMHGDHHGLWIDPDNSNYLVNVNDGGLAISYDAGENWRTFNDQLPLVQFFNVSHDMDEPFHVFGSIQDHGSRRGVVDLSAGRQNIPAVDWEGTPGGEGSRHAIDPTDPSIVYSAGFYGTISRTDISTNARSSIMPVLDVEGAKLRGQWLASFVISPHNPRVIYHGMNYLFRSMDRGDVWERISPDLTHNNLDELGDIPYQTIFSIAESPFHFGKIYVGTDDGRIHRTDDHGVSWNELTGHLPYKKWISRIVASVHQEGLVYVSQNGKRDDDFTPYLYKSIDSGMNWVDISGNIPSGPINVVTEDPRNSDVLYVGTDIGAYVSIDAGQSWDVLGDGLPVTFVSDITVHPRDDILVASTHGRGMYALDIRNIQQMTTDVLAADLHVFPTEAAVLPSGRFGPVQQAHIFYSLKDAGSVTVDIIGGEGNTLKSIEGSGDMGMNVAVWDLSQQSPEDGRVNRGIYKIIVTSGSVSVESSVEVR